MSDLSADDRGIVDRNLSAGEHVQWLGRPDPAKHFNAGDVYLVPFSILWAGFSIFWEATAIASGAGPFFALWGIPFIVIGLYVVVGRFFYKAYRKRHTLYAVTDRRVLILAQRRRGERVDAMYLRAIPTISTSVDSAGRGSVQFGNTSPFGMWNANSGMEFFGRVNSATTGVAFYDVDDARAVGDLVERLREQDQPAAATR
jgi:hypothetical protein